MCVSFSVTQSFRALFRTLWREFKRWKTYLCWLSAFPQREDSRDRSSLPRHESLTDLSKDQTYRIVVNRVPLSSDVAGDTRGRRAIRWKIRSSPCRPRSEPRSATQRLRGVCLSRSQNAVSSRLPFRIRKKRVALCRSLERERKTPRNLCPSARVGGARRSRHPKPAPGVDVVRLERRSETRRACAGSGLSSLSLSQRNSKADIWHRGEESQWGRVSCSLSLSLSRAVLDTKMNWHTPLSISATRVRVA